MSSAPGRTCLPSRLTGTTTLRVTLTFRRACRSKRRARFRAPASKSAPPAPGASAGDNHAAHCRDWLRACKGGAPACSNFSVAGPYAEWVVLGAIAVHFEGKLMWDAAKMEFTNNRDANKWVKPMFRKGWE